MGGKPPQVEQFSRQLRPHQMAMLPDGTTVLARAVIEHNLAAASRLYTAIYFDQLGALLGVPEAAAETTAARMVQEDRLKVRGACLPVSDSQGSCSTQLALKPLPASLVQEEDAARGRSPAG